jgi:hypothetical protein
VYEIAISVYESNIVWVNGPFQASKNDVLIYTNDGLQAMIPDGCRAIADGAYSGAEKAATRNKLDSKEVRHFKRRVRARHENVNARIKSFHVTSIVFRHGVKRHKTAFEACCVAVQYDMEQGHPLWDV